MGRTASSARQLIQWSLLLLAFGSAAHASPWTLSRGGVYGYAGFFYTRSDQFYNSRSERVEYAAGGTTRLSGFMVQASYGLTDRFMLSGGLPVLWYHLEDNFIRDTGRSFGDTRMSLRSRLVEAPIAAALEVGVKFPTATTKDPSRAQVGEGQRDYELIGSLGKALPDWAVRASADVGYRWRRRNSDNGIKPGNELIYRLELSYDISQRLSANTYLDGFDGDEGDVDFFGLSIPTTSARSIAIVVPNIAYKLDSRWQVNVSAQVPVAGRRSYGGTQLLVGLSYNRAKLDGYPAIGGISAPSGGGCCRIQ